MSESSRATEGTTSNGTIGSTGRTVVSLLLIIHFFFLVLALAANFAPSRVVGRLLSRFGFYTQLLHLDRNAVSYDLFTSYHNFAPLHLTHATIDDVGHLVEVLPRGADPEDENAWQRVGGRGWAGSESQQRYQRWGRMMAFFAEDDEMASRFAADCVRHVIHHADMRPTRIRLRKHLLQPWNVIEGGTPEQRDPFSSQYYQIVYEADLIITPQGAVRVLKISQSNEVATPSTEREEDNGSGS